VGAHFLLKVTGASGQVTRVVTHPAGALWQKYVTPFRVAPPPGISQ
jgi:hypothetical protein